MVAPVLVEELPGPSVVPPVVPGTLGVEVPVDLREHSLSKEFSRRKLLRLTRKLELSSPRQNLFQN